MNKSSREDLFGTLLFFTCSTQFSLFLITDCCCFVFQKTGWFYENSSLATLGLIYLKILTSGTALGLSEPPSFGRAVNLGAISRGSTAFREESIKFCRGREMSAFDWMARLKIPSIWSVRDDSMLRSPSPFPGAFGERSTAVALAFRAEFSYGSHHCP